MKLNSEAIKQLRIDNGLRLSDVAARLQISEPTASRYENGQVQRVSPRIMLGYSKLFRVPINYLYVDAECEWVNALQEAGLRDPRVAGFIEYLEEQAEREMNGGFSLSEEEQELIIEFRKADDRTKRLVAYDLGLKKILEKGVSEDEGTKET